MAKHYTELPVEKWNTKHFTDYLTAEHKRIFGVDYVPFGGVWAKERGMIGGAIGTARKPGSHDKALIKTFIDVCFAEYTPTRDYPGTNFGFMWSYRKNVLQRLQAESLRKASAKDAVQASDNDNIDKLAEWL